MHDKSLEDRADDHVDVRQEYVNRTQAEASRLTAPKVITTTRKPWWDDDDRVLPKHVFVPDVQAKEGVPIEHLAWAAKYICAKKPDVIVLAMDWWDYPAFSYWATNKADFKMRNAMRDFLAGLHAWDTFFAVLRAEKAKSGYAPMVVCTEGNHDARVWRFLQEDSRADRSFPTPRQVAEAEGCLWYPYLTPVVIDGVSYCHFFANPMTGKPYGGQMETRLKTIGHSFTMGHQQTYLMGCRSLDNGETQRGLVAGSFYQHDEDYKGSQGNHHKRGIFIKHAVENGDYNLMEVDMAFLRRRYGGPQILARGDYLESELGWETILKNRVRAAPRKKSR